MVQQVRVATGGCPVMPRLLNLVIDAFVAAYLKGSEEESDRKAEVQVPKVFFFEKMMVKTCKKR